MLPSLDFGSHTLAVDDLPIDDTNVNNRSEACGETTIARTESCSEFKSDLRFTKPTPFQESRNFWKRNIAAHQSRMDAAAEHLSTSNRRPHILGRTKRHASIDSTQSSLPASSEGDNEASICPQRLCRPSAIPTWPHLRQARNRHSTPVVRNNVTRSPKRKLSTRVVSTSEASISPKRAFMPRRVQSRGKIPFLRGSENDSKTAEDLIGVGENEILVKMEVEVYNEVAQPGETPVFERHACAQSIWNDPNEQLNFTSTWRDHQDGHTTKDAFLGKLAFESTNEQQCNDQNKPRTLMKSVDFTATSPAPPTSTDSAIGSTTGPIAPTPPTRRSSKDKGIYEAKPLQITRLQSRRRLDGIDEDQALEQEIQEIQEIYSPARTPLSTQNIRAPSSIPVLPGSNIVLKNARSVESISQIEAMISPKTPDLIDAPAQSKSPQKRSGKQPRRPSKPMRPAGQPPERPLPELPVDNEITKHQHRVSDSSTKQRDSIVCDTSNFGNSPGSVATVEAPSPKTPTDAIRLTQMSSGKIEGLSIAISDTHDPVPANAKVIDLDSIPFPDTASPSVPTRVRSLSKRKASTGRSEKVRELKRKHMAAMGKGREVSAAEQPGQNVGKASDYTSIARQVSRYTQTTEMPVCTSHLPPPLPPPPTTTPSKYQSTFSTPPKTKKESVDELDQFPRVPPSRPGSRASVAPTIQSTRGITRTTSPTRKSRSRGRTLQGRNSLNQDSRHFGRQLLSHSLIYINVDTDPVTANFRASAISRSPSRTRRASSPRKHATEPPSPVSLSKVATSPKVSLVKQKQSSRSLRSQSSIARNTARHGLERVSPATFSRPGSRHNPGLLSSDEYTEYADFIPKRISSARPGSKSSNKSRASRKRKENPIPQLPMTGQFAMEHVLMALAKCQNQGLDISLLSPVDVEKLAVQQKVEDELDSRAAKRLSMAQRPQRPSSGRFDESSRLLKVKMKLPRPRSDVSNLTVTGTDTDASARRLSDGYSSLDKRCSAGSLTDPTDMEIHDMKPMVDPLQSQRTSEHTRLVRTRRRPSSPTLSTKSFSYYQTQSHPRQPAIAKRASLMLMAPPIAPPRTTSRMQTDLGSSTVSLTSRSETEKPAAGYNDVLDLDETSTSDPFMLGMLDGMATWTNPVVDRDIWRTWGDQERIIVGKALFTPPSTAVNSVCVP